MSFTSVELARASHQARVLEFEENRRARQAAVARRLQARARRLMARAERASRRAERADDRAHLAAARVL